MHSPADITRVALAALLAFTLAGATGETTAPARASVDRKLTADLLTACEAGDVTRIAHLIDLGADPNAQDEAGYTCVFGALEGGSAELVQLLARHGADLNHLNKKGFSALGLAVAAGDEKVAAALVAAGAKVDQRQSLGFTPLHLAASTGQVSMAKRLLDAGAAPDARTDDGEPPLVVALIELGRQARPTPATAAERHLGKVAKAQGVDVPSMHVHPDDLRAVIALLLDRGADPNGKFRGRTPVEISVNDGLADVTALLLRHGVDPNSRDFFGIPILAVAALKGALETTQLLLSKGANPNAAAPDGSTALHMATASNALPVVTALVEQGADVEATTGERMTPLLLSPRHLVEVSLKVFPAELVVAASDGVPEKHRCLRLCWVKLRPPASQERASQSYPPAARGVGEVLGLLENRRGMQPHV